MPSSSARKNGQTDVEDGLPDIETTEFLLAKIDDFGTPDAYNHYALGWAHALCTPYQWTKQVASHWGGTRNGTVVHWPKGIAGKGETRDQFHHVIDVAPTILEAAHIPAPTVVNSIQQAPLEGVSMTGHSSASIRILPAGVSSSREHQEQVALGDR